MNLISEHARLLGRFVFGKFVKTCRELNNSPENSSPGAFGGFGAGSSSSKFDFFNSAGGMFGGGTGSSQEETGNGSGGKYNFLLF